MLIPPARPEARKKNRPPKGGKNTDYHRSLVGPGTGKVGAERSSAAAFKQKEGGSKKERIDVCYFAAFPYRCRPRGEGSDLSLVAKEGVDEKKRGPAGQFCPHTSWSLRKKEGGVTTARSRRLGRETAHRKGSFGKKERGKLLAFLHPGLIGKEFRLLRRVRASESEVEGERGCCYLELCPHPARKEKGEMVQPVDGRRVSIKCEAPPLVKKRKVAVPVTSLR